MDRLSADIEARLRPYELSARLETGRETLALVGPSGAGKSTVLRAIAGLLRPHAGRIALGEELWFDSVARVDVPPERRSVGMVFQDYALFPHLTVRENVAFGGGERADELLERLRISPLAGERPGTLSGGERQRVALARALARDPSVLLLDEPLAALDAHTRAAVRGELQDLLEQLALPAIVVTHDFRDAAALAGRAAVMVDGRVLQHASIAELVESPADAFVASFTGASLLAGMADGAGRVILDEGGSLELATRASGRLVVAVYPWEVELHRERPPARPGRAAVQRVVASVTPDEGRARVRAGELVAEADPALGVSPGETLWATFPFAPSRVLPERAPATLPDAPAKP